MATHAIRASAMHRTCVTMLAGCCAVALLGGVGVGAATAQELGSLIRMTGTSPFAGCTADNVASQDGVNYPNTEIEPSNDKRSWRSLNTISPTTALSSRPDGGRPPRGTKTSSTHRTSPSRWARGPYR